VRRRKAKIGWAVGRGIGLWTVLLVGAGKSRRGKLPDQVGPTCKKRALPSNTPSPHPLPCLTRPPSDPEAPLLRVQASGTGVGCCFSSSRSSLATTMSSSSSRSSSWSPSFGEGGGGGAYDGHGSPVSYCVGPLDYQPETKCYCNVKACQWISWSFKNSGMRYLKCQKARLRMC